MGIEQNQESLEESIFRTLSNLKRRDILRFIGERKAATFTEIKKTLQIEDNSLVSYHLSSLQTLVIQKNKKYALSELGQEAYNLIIKTNTYASNNVVVQSIRKQLSALVIVNALLWAAAILAVTEFQGNLTQPTYSVFAVLWLMSNLVIYGILKQTSPIHSCFRKN
jgi:hypothetical protein